MKCKDCGVPIRRSERCAACEYKWLYVLDPERLAAAAAKMQQRRARLHESGAGRRKADR